MRNGESFHMTSEEFRRYGRAVIDWIADYYERVESFPVLAQVQPGEIRSALPPAPPVQGEAFEDILRDVDRFILPGITHWQSPNFYAYFPANTSGPAILGELMSAGLGVQGMLWATSPACTELETHVLDWVAEMLALPARFRSGSAGGGVIQDSASSAVLCALLAARERAALFDETSFSKIEVLGPGALAFLQRLCANDIDKPVGWPRANGPRSTAVTSTVTMGAWWPTLQRRRTRR